MQMPLIVAAVQHSQLHFMVGLIRQHLTEKACCCGLTCMLQNWRRLASYDSPAQNSFQLIVLKPYAQGRTEM